MDDRPPVPPLTADRKRARELDYRLHKELWCFSRASSEILRSVATNSELLLEGYDAWNRDDLDGYLGLLHPEVQISTAGMFPDLALEYSGRQQAAKFWRQMHEPWERFRIEVEHVEDDGPWAIASILFTGCGADSGVEVEMRFGMAMRVEDGLGIQFVNRRTFDEARTAVRSGDAGSVART